METHGPTNHGRTRSQRDKRHARYERLLKTRDREGCHPGGQAGSREELRREAEQTRQVCRRKEGRCGEQTPAEDGQQSEREREDGEVKGQGEVGRERDTPSNGGDGSEMRPETRRRGGEGQHILEGAGET